MEGSFLKKKLTKQLLSEEELTPWEKAQAKRQRLQKQQKPKRHRQAKKLPLLAQVKRNRLEKTGGSLLIIFLTITLISLYFILPISRISSVKVVGVQGDDKTTVLTASKIKSGQTLLGVWWTQSKLENGIIRNVGLVRAANIKTVKQQVVIRVKKYQTVAYIEKAGQYYELEQNGSISLNGQSEIAGNLPLIANKKNANFHLLAKQLDLLPNKLLLAISEIHFTPTKADPTKILVYMNDGNRVIADAEDFAKKMAYYPSIVAKMDYQGTVDLEVGAYSYPSKKSE